MCPATSRVGYYDGKGVPPPAAVVVGVPRTYTMCLPGPSATELGVPPRVVSMRGPRDAGGETLANARTVSGPFSALCPNVRAIVSFKIGVTVGVGRVTITRAAVGYIHMTALPLVALLTRHPAGVDGR